ncbi:DUF4190 domain-containing protein [Pullulanibacillus sp. KACC 23026]|uniref:DUF4190 domain-containing protein n=1 Tax=Pullulanibacillus sp. KACC 23026 TaxID=3028315 RepID=UPI0023AF6736|nr:DUF4190 domain-containing protein [Pullulanibacillus sp. KACC 23026]WEG14452.1 DUF4190 domain-containing protein [Pullulanibacillus sp. KACC 23026]
MGYIINIKGLITVSGEGVLKRNVSNRKALTSLVFGILSIIFYFCVGIILGVIGLIVGIVALKEIKRFKQEGRKRATIGVI